MRGALLLLLLLLFVPTKARAKDLWNFALLPRDGAIRGCPEQVIGWGFEIENLSEKRYLLLTQISSDRPIEGIAGVLCSHTALRAISPKGKRTFPFKKLPSFDTFPPISCEGAFDIRLSGSATQGSIGKGNFQAEAYWYDTEPFISGFEGSFAGAADMKTVPYEYKVECARE